MGARCVVLGKQATINLLCLVSFQAGAEWIEEPNRLLGSLDSGWSVGGCFCWPSCKQVLSNFRSEMYMVSQKCFLFFFTIERPLMGKKNPSKEPKIILSNYQTDISDLICHGNRHTSSEMKNIYACWRLWRIVKLLNSKLIHVNNFSTMI